MPTKQETFDTCAVHLLSMDHPCKKDGLCAYLNDQGQKCVIGVLIPSERYTDKFEGERICPNDPCLPIDRLMIELGHNLDLLADLQFCHDAESIGLQSWQKHVRRILPDIAAKHGLNANVLQRTIAATTVQPG